MSAEKKRWPVHPPPLPDETLSSWLLRVARANASSLSSWLPVVGSDYGGVLSLDTVEDRGLWARIAFGARLRAGATSVEGMTFLPVLGRMPKHVAGRWLLSMDDRVSRSKHGYCALCFAADERPHLRRAWRMEWHRWCPEHGCRLEWACMACGAELAPWRTDADRPFTACWKCGCDVARRGPRGEVAYATAPRFVMEAIVGANALVLGDDEDGAHRALVLEEVWCLQKWAELVGHETWPAWVAKLGIGVSQEATPPSAEDAVTWSFALAWHTATTARRRIGDLVCRHQAAFNRAIAVNCPPSLRALRRAVTVARKVTEDEIEEVVTSLVEGDMPVNYLAVAEALCVSPGFISARPTLRAVVDRALPVVLKRWCDAMRLRLTESRDRLARRGARLSRVRLAEDAGVSLEAIARFERESGETFAVLPSETYEKEVQGAIARLRGEGNRITTVAVCRVLHRDRSFIEKNPELKRLVAVAREARPTVDEVQGACKKLYAETNRAVTTVSVAQALGRGRHTIERSETLRAALEAEKAAERKAVEAKIRAAIRALVEQGEEVTMAGVCRVMGRHRSYIEKRGRLREIVMRARRGS